MSQRLEDYESVKRWFLYISTDRTSSESTKRLYLWAMARFVQFSGRTPDQMIAERHEDWRSSDNVVRQKYETLLREAFQAMENDEKKSRATCGAFFASVKSFFKANWEPLVCRSPAIWPSKMFKVPNQEEIRRMCEVSDPRIRSWILMQKDSGLSAGDLIELNYESMSPLYGTVRDQLKSGQVPLHLNLMRGKFKQMGFHDTFLGEEAFDALQEKKGERIFDISTRYIRYLLPKAGRKAGLKGPTVTPHSLRKFFNTYAKIGIRDYGATELLVEYWMGHSLGRVKAAYLAPPVEEQQKLYLTAYPKLSCLK